MPSPKICGPAAVAAADAAVGALVGRVIGAAADAAVGAFPDSPKRTLSTTGRGPQPTKKKNRGPQPFKIKKNRLWFTGLKLLSTKAK